MKKEATPNRNLPLVRTALRELGSDIQLARRRRRIRQQDFATSLGVSVDTVRRLESGDPGLSVGTLCRACLALGHIKALRTLISMPEQETSFLFDAPPERIRRAKPKTSYNEQRVAGPDWERGLF